MPGTGRGDPDIAGNGVPVDEEAKIGSHRVGAHTECRQRLPMRRWVLVILAMASDSDGSTSRSMVPGWQLWVKDSVATFRPLPGPFTSGNP